MGLGGALIWSAVFRNLAFKHPDKKIVVRYKTSILNIFKEPGDFIVYRQNPRVHLIANNYLWPFQRLRLRSGDFLLVDFQDPSLWYWGKDTPEKLIYKMDKLHAIEYATKHFGIEKADLHPEIYLSKEEKDRAVQRLKEYDLYNNRYICFEPNTKGTFSSNKAWAKDRWPELIKRLQDYNAINGMGFKFIQIGSLGGIKIDGLIDMRGVCTFREAAEILRRSSFLVSYAGGLVHLAAAVDTPAVVLISAWEPKETLAYPNNINLYTDLDCAICGLKTPCPRGCLCMDRITVDMVFDACSAVMDKTAGQ